MNVVNDNSCGWINDLDTRSNVKTLDKDEFCDWLIVGAGYYNGSGIGVGTLFGEQIAIKASMENSQEINIIEKRNKPNLLPPQPFLYLGVKTRLVFERLKAKNEI